MQQRRATPGSRLSCSGHPKACEPKPEPRSTRSWPHCSHGPQPQPVPHSAHRPSKPSSQQAPNTPGTPRSGSPSANQPTLPSDLTDDRPTPLSQREAEIAAPGRRRADQQADRNPPVHIRTHRREPRPQHHEQDSASTHEPRSRAGSRPPTRRHEVRDGSRRLPTPVGHGMTSQGHTANDDLGPPESWPPGCPSTRRCCRGRRSPSQPREPVSHRHPAVGSMAERPAGSTLNWAYRLGTP